VATVEAAATIDCYLTAVGSVGDKVREDIDADDNWLTSKGISPKESVRALQVVSNIVRARETALALAAVRSRSAGRDRPYYGTSTTGGINTAPAHGDKIGERKPTGSGKGRLDIPQSLIEERIKMRVCLKCGQSGHRKTECTNKLNRDPIRPRANKVRAQPTVGESDEDVEEEEEEESENDRQRQGKAQAQ
jgi:hypothetical protein